MLRWPGTRVYSSHVSYSKTPVHLQANMIAVKDMEPVSKGITASKHDLVSQAVQTLLMGKEDQIWCQNKQTVINLGKTLQTEQTNIHSSRNSIVQCTCTSVKQLLVGILPTTL